MRANSLLREIPCRSPWAAACDREPARASMIEDDAFSRCVAMGRPAFPDFRTALSAHEVVDACSRGARLGREVSLGEP